MISGLVPFPSILESVKDETGIQNLRPHEDRIRRLLFRAEREIGYGGSVVLKKVIFDPAASWDGIYFPYPEDFIELEGVGQNCCGLPHYMFTRRPEGIRFKCAQTTKTVLLYWGILCDGYGNPCTTRNHEEAVVSYIVWKLYSPKMFLGTGNMNAAEEFKRRFTQECGAARGDDAFPTLEDFNEIGFLTYQDRRPLLMQPTASYNYCAETAIQDCAVIEPDVMKVYYFQRTHFAETLEELANTITQNFLDTKPVQTFEVFEQGYLVDNSAIGKLAFVIKETEVLDFAFTDALNNDITDDFDTMYLAEQRAMLFLSKNVLSYSTIYYKFKKLLSNA